MRSCHGRREGVWRRSSPRGWPLFGGQKRQLVSFICISPIISARIESVGPSQLGLQAQGVRSLRVGRDCHCDVLLGSPADSDPKPILSSVFLYVKARLGEALVEQFVVAREGWACCEALLWWLSSMSSSKAQSGAADGSSGRPSF